LSLETIFRAFFDDWLIEWLVSCTNCLVARIRQKEAFEQLDVIQRPWKDVNVLEVLAYISTLIWMGLYPVLEVELYWNTNQDIAPLYHPITKCFSLKRWEQIYRYFHVCDPLHDFDLIRLKSSQNWTG
jgi:transposase IS4-like protein